MRRLPGAPRAVAVLLLAVMVAALLGSCGTARVTRGTVRFVREDEAVRARPVITLVSVPGPNSDTLRLRLTRKLLAPVYEADVTEEQARSMDLRNIVVIALGAISGGGIRLGTREGTTIVRGEPRRIKDLDEVEQAWAGGTVRFDGADGAARELTADGEGWIRVRVVDLVPVTAVDRDVRLTVSAAIGAERDTKIVDVDRETIGRWRGR